MVCVSVSGHSGLIASPIGEAGQGRLPPSKSCWPRRLPNNSTDEQLLEQEEPHDVLRVRSVSGAAQSCESDSKLTALAAELVAQSCDRDFDNPLRETRLRKQDVLRRMTQRRVSTEAQLRWICLRRYVSSDGRGWQRKDISQGSRRRRPPPLGKRGPQPSRHGRRMLAAISGQPRSQRRQNRIAWWRQTCSGVDVGAVIANLGRHRRILDRFRQTMAGVGGV